MIGAILSDTMDIFVEQLTAMGVKLTDEQIKLARAKTATEIGLRSSKETRLAEVAPELLASVKELLPHATRAIEQLNQQMVGNLYPAINLAKLDRAEAAIARAEQQS